MLKIGLCLFWRRQAGLEEDPIDRILEDGTTRILEDGTTRTTE